MKIKMIFDKEIYLFKETFSIFLCTLIISCFVLLNFLLLEVIDILAIFTFYLRFFCYFTAAFYLFKIKANYKNKILFKPNFTNFIITVLLFIIFNAIFPIKQINEIFYFINFANIWIIILSFTILSAFILHLSIYLYIKNITKNNYFSLFIALKVLFIVTISLLFLFWDLLIKIKFLFRKVLNFVITNFQKSKLLESLKITQSNFEDWFLFLFKNIKFINR